jgi:hypothetical protein
MQSFNKGLAAFLMASFVFSATVCAAVEIDPHNYGDLTFYYTMAGQPIVRQDPAGGGRPTFHPGNPYGTDILNFGVNEAPQPAGVTTHTITFDFYSENYFSRNPSGHIALMLKGRWYNDNPNTAINEFDFSGRGIAIGNVSGRPDGCQNPPAAQVESFWKTGNAIFPQSCSLRLRDNFWYKVTVHANNNRWVGYWITDYSGNIFYANAAVQDPASHISESLGGWLFAPVFNDSQTLNWKIWLRNVRTTWF